jgi:hypothetical protein
MYQIITAKDGTQFKISPSAYALVAYKQITGRDLFSDMQVGFTKERVDITVLLDILFAMCYCHDSELDYRDFFKALPVKIAVDTVLHGKLVDVLTKEFGIEAPKDKITPSTQ